MKTCGLAFGRPDAGGDRNPTRGTTSISPRIGGWGAFAAILVLLLLALGGSRSLAATGPTQILTVNPTFTGLTSNANNGQFTGGGGGMGNSNTVDETGAAVSVAAGPTTVVEMTNDGITMWNKTTGQVVFRQRALDTWFASALVTGTFYQPQVIYDQYMGRWITIALAGATGAMGNNLGSMLVIGVSSGTDPTNAASWQFTSTNLAVSTRVTATDVATFDAIGLDQTTVYIAADLFSAMGNFDQAIVRTISKTVLYARPLVSPLVATSYNDLFPPGASSIIPCHSYGAASSEYLVATVPPAGATGGGGGTGGGGNGGGNGGGTSSSTTINLWGVMVDPMTGPMVTSMDTVTTQPFTDPPPVQQKTTLGSTGLFKTGDSRLRSAVYRNGDIWTAGNTGASSGSSLVSAIHWLRINASTASVLTDQVLSGPTGTFYFSPAITADSANNVYIGYNQSSSTTFPSLAVAAYSNAGTAVAQQQVVAGGTSDWGFNSQMSLYNGIALDPTSQAAVWVAGDYPIFGRFGSNSVATSVAKATFGTTPYLAYLLTTPGATDTWGAGLSGGQVVGYSSGPSTGGVIHATSWSNVLAAPTDLTPASTQQTQATGVSGATVAGSTNFAGYLHATLFGTGGPVDLNPAGFLTSNVSAVSAGQEVGYGYLPGKDFRALLWTGTAGSAVDLTPPGFVRAYAFGISGGREVGGAVTSGGIAHPLLWTGNALSYFDLLPTGFLGAYATGVEGTSQVGYGWLVTPADNESAGITHALFWSGTAASAIDLNGSFDSSTLAGISGNQQVGSAYGGSTQGTQHAMVWSTTSGSAFDLHSTLPPGYLASWATGIDTAGNIVGTAVDPTGHRVAVVWAPMTGP